MQKKRIEINVPNVNRGDLADTMIIEHEVRNFIRRPICRPHAEAEKAELLYLEPAQMSLVQANDDQNLQMWTCPKCDYTIRLPKGMFPEPAFKIVELKGPRDVEPATEEQ